MTQALTRPILVVMAKATKVPVSQRALIQRINRALAKENEALKAARSERDRQQLGNYFVIDLHRNTVQAQHVDLEALARELGVLKPYEALAD